MSLLAKPTAPNIPVEMKIRGQVQQIKIAPRRLTDTIVREWTSAFDKLWTTVDNITPAQKLAAIGPDAAELFAANAALTQFLVTMLTGKDDELVTQVLSKVATIPPFTVNQDGTVTLN